MLLAIYSIVYIFRVWVFWPGPSSPVSVGSSALVCFPSWRGPGYEHQWWASSGPRALSYLLRLQQVLTCLLGLEKTPFPLLVEWQQLVQGSWCSLCLWCVKASLCAKCSQMQWQGCSSSWEQRSVNAEPTGLSRPLWLDRALAPAQQGEGKPGWSHEGGAISPGHLP